MPIVRIDSEIYLRVQEVAQKSGCSIARTVNSLLEDTLDEADFEKSFAGMTEEEFRNVRLTPERAKELVDAARLKRKELEDAS